MEYKRFSKSELKRRCIIESMRLCYALNLTRHSSDGTCVPGLSFLQIAGLLNITQAQMSRISTGVCCPSAPVFFRLQELYSEYVINSNYELLG